ncbi:BCCT family transporter [Helcobacillus massiliensis]|uniref:Choline/carnitine/betaine transport n=2 Tax=Helcobacillus TaxID=1161125 RepID=A0A839QTY1_9MICO|nr:choline/carnitine/betaine transport [Helcobacillus massiliensis]
MTPPHTSDPSEQSTAAARRAAAHPAAPGTPSAGAAAAPVGAPARAKQAAGRFFKEMDRYPHNIHPALVPGVDVDDQRIRYGIDKPMLIIVGAAVTGFVLWGVIQPDVVLAATTAALGWIMTNLGWVFNSLAIGMVLFLLFLAFSKYGRIPLGLEGDKPEYSTVSWAAMLFGAGIGIGIIFFGPYEPMTYYLSPRPGAYEPASMEAVKGAMVQAALHWGVNAWAIYAIVGLAVAYVSFRRGRVPLMSSILTPLWGGGTDSVPARIIDGLAIIATLFGTAASLGIGALQIGSGFTLVTGWSPGANTLALVIIVLLTIGTIISAVSGVAKGIKRLSNVNLMLAMVLALFFFVAGPTVFLVNIIPGVITQYFSQLPEMLSATTADSEEMNEFLSTWTTFYWAWWVSWAPFVGVFTAKISKGRTVRQFVIGVLTIPSTIIVLAFTILGGTSIYLQRHNGERIAPGNDIDALPKPEDIFFAVLDQLPGAQFVAPIVIVMLAVFFITTSDSASLVNSQLSQKGNPNPNRWVTAFWAILMAGIAVVILLMAGKDALQGLQNLITITALPFAVVLVLMAVALFKEMRTDPLVIRSDYEKSAVANAVRYGIEEHGDNFSLRVIPEEGEYAAGAGYDSHAEELTDWYARTDEDGNPVAYDYEIGAYLDEHGNPVDEDGKLLEDEERREPRGEDGEPRGEGTDGSHRAADSDA